MAPWSRASLLSLPRAPLLALGLALGLAAATPRPARGEDAAALLRQADWTAEIARAGLSVRVTVDDGAAPVGALLRSSGSALRVDVESPAARAGEVLLYANGRWWFSRPGLRRPAPVSAGQVLGARAATADLVLLLDGFSENYKIESQSTDTLDGQAAQRLDLVAATPEADWPSLRVWLTGTPARIGQVAVISAGGKVSRTARIAWDQSVASASGKRPFPSVVTLTDGAGKALATLTYGAPTAAPLDDALFDPARLAAP